MLVSLPPPTVSSLAIVVQFIDLIHVLCMHSLILLINMSILNLSVLQNRTGKRCLLP